MGNKISIWEDEYITLADGSQIQLKYMGIEDKIRMVNIQDDSFHTVQVQKIKRKEKK